MGVVYRHGDVTSVKEGIIAHGVNCQGVMGAGVALAIRNKYPQVYKEYKRKCLQFSNEYLLGKLDISYQNGVYIANLFTQNKYDRNRKCFEGIAFENCIDILFGFMTKNNLYNVNMPKIGDGLAGGEWVVNEKIIKDKLSGYPEIEVNVWELKNTRGRNIK